MKQIFKISENHKVLKYLTNQSFQILTLVILSFVLFISTFYVLFLPKLEESYYDSRKKLLKDMVTSAEGLVFDYYIRYESGELTENEAKKRLKKRLASLKYDNNFGYFWIINRDAVLVSHPYSLNILGKKIRDLENTPEKEVLLKMHELGKDSSEGYVYYKWTQPGNIYIYSEKVAYIKMFKPWVYIIGTGAYLDDIKLQIHEMNVNMSRAFLVIGLILLSFSIYIIISIHRLNAKKEKAYNQLFATELKYSNFFDSTFQFIAVLDKNGYIQEINRSACEFLDLNKEKLQNKLFWDTPYWATDLEAKLKLISGFQKVQKGEFIRFEAKHSDFKGRFIVVDFSLKPLFDAEGNFIQAIAEGRDITVTKKVELALKISEERLSKVLNQSPMATVIFNIKGVKSYSNESWHHLWSENLGYKEDFNLYEETQHKKFGYPDAFDKARAGIASMIGPFQFKSQDVDSDNSLWLYSFVYPLTENERVSEIVILYEDQTTRINVSKALEQSEHWYRSLFDNAIDGILILENDRILEANPEFYNLFNSSPAVMNGKSIYDFSQAIQYNNEPANELGNMFLNNALQGQSVNFEWLHKREDGTTFDAEISLAKVEFDERVLSMAFIRDITERKRAYDAIQSMVEAVAAYTGQEFFNSVALNLNKILKSNYALIGVLENDSLVNSIALAKNNRIIDNVVFSVEGTPCENIFNSGMVVYHEDIAKIFPKDKVLSDLGIEGYVGTPLICSNNKLIGVLLALYETPIDDDILSKEVLQIFAGRIAAEMERANYQNELINLNKTLEKRINERTYELQQINTELKDFAYIVSHDLKAPLRGISQLSGWIRSDLEDKLETENIEMFDLLQSRIRKMYTLIDGVLDYSRVGRIEDQATIIDMNELLLELFEIVKDDRSSAIDIVNVLPVIKADKTRISQLFQNLFSNAFKYNDKDEVLITIDFAESETQFKFIVTDNGVGVDEKYFTKIFNIFQTIDASDENSTGIGLSIVKKIVEYYGGSIFVESKIKEGTSFILEMNKDKVM